MEQKTKLLYLCTGNSCRSQMAEGLTRHLKGDLFDVFSAGVETHGLNENAVTVMQEIGIDISHHKSQHIDEFKNIKLDCIITVCGHANETCPFFPSSTKIIHVGFDDPPKMVNDTMSNEEKLDCYRKVRDQIKEFVLRLPEGIN